MPRCGIEKAVRLVAEQISRDIIYVTTARPINIGWIKSRNVLKILLATGKGAIGLDDMLINEIVPGLASVAVTTGCVEGGGRR